MPAPRTALNRLRKYLQNLDDDDVLNFGELTYRGGFGGTTLSVTQAELIEEGLCLRVEDQRARVYYGNQNAIKSLRKRLTNPSLL